MSSDDLHHDGFHHDDFDREVADQNIADSSVIEELLHRLCDERLSAAEQASLLEELRTSPAARRRYREFVALSISLADWSVPAKPSPVRPACALGEPGLSRYPNLAVAGSESPKLPKGAGVSAPKDIQRERRLRLSALALAASLLIAVTLLVATSGFFLGEPRAVVSALSSPSATRLDYVARVLEVTHDTEWDVEAMPREFLMRIRPGEQIRLLRGLAMIEFYSGAQLILHGPARFQPTGKDAGLLYEGKVTGRVSNGNFHLMTPTAEVIDLGTEFGVSVGADTGTDVLVFDGEVEVRSDASDPRTMSESVNLSEGMTVRVDHSGQLSGNSQLTSDRFSRRFSGLSPSADSTTELSLVDILCGGSGKGQRLAAAIDPLTGEWDRLGWQSSKSPGTRHGDVKFHAASWHPMIDGAFIPVGDGKETQVDSLGNTILLTAHHDVTTWGPIWARRFSKDLTIASRTKDNDFWGADTFPVISSRLEDSHYGGVGIHASVGISFDLDRIRKEHHAEISSFKALLTNLDNSSEHNPEYARANERSANFRVVVDGTVRHERLNFKRNIAGVALDVPIEQGDRMLTLLTTDAGNSNKYDHIVLIDPVLNLYPFAEGEEP